MTKSRRPRNKPASGQGAAPSASGTRAHLLETAGQVFARRGFSLTTGKEICQVAGVNAAAINYHFSGIESLYQAVLHEVIERMISVQALSERVNATTGARARLRAVISFFVQALTGPLGGSWELRILAREVVTPASPLLLEKEIADRMKIIKDVVGDVMDLPAAHPAVAVGYLSVMAPSLLLLIGDRDRFRRVFPSLKFDPATREAIVERLVHAAYGALRELGKFERRGGSD